MLLPATVSAHGPLHEQIARVSKLIAQYPDSAALYLKRGELHRHHRDWTAALFDYDRAERLGPGMTEVELCRGIMLLQAGWLEKAKSAINRFLANKPDEASGLLVRARVLAQLGEHVPAAEDFRRAIARTTTPQPEYYLECARALCAAGDEHIDAALSCLDDGLRKLGRIVTLQLYAIELEIKQQRYDAALARLENIAAQSPRKAKWLLRRGEILQMAGRHEEARSAFELALQEIESLPPGRRQAKAMVDLEKRLRARKGF